MLILLYVMNLNSYIYNILIISPLVKIALVLKHKIEIIVELIPNYKL
jgi:hypothetical protein